MAGSAVRISFPWALPGRCVRSPAWWRSIVGVRARCGCAACSSRSARWRLRHRRAGLPLQPRRSSQAGRHRPIEIPRDGSRVARAHAPQPRLLLLRPVRARAGACCWSAHFKRTGSGRMIVGVRRNELRRLGHDGLAGPCEADQRRLGGASSPASAVCCWVR